MATWDEIEGPATPAPVTRSESPSAPSATSWDSIEAPAASPTAGDYLRAVGAGVGDVITGVGQLGEWATGGSMVRRAGQDVSGYFERNMTPGGREAMQRPFVEEVPEGENRGLFGYDIGPGLTSPSTIALQALRSAPSTAAMIIPGAGAARVAEGALATRAGSAAAGRAAAATAAGTRAAPGAAAAMTGYGATEGALTAGQNAAQTTDTINRMPIETLRTAPEFQQRVAALDPSLPLEQREAQARDELARSAGARVGAITAPVTGILGGVGGHSLETLIREAPRGVLRPAARQGVVELATETPQSGAEQLVQNLEERRADPTRTLGHDVVNQAIGGGITGAVMGAGTGGATALMPRPAPAAAVPPAPPPPPGAVSPPPGTPAALPPAGPGGAPPTGTVPPAAPGLQPAAEEQIAQTPTIVAPTAAVDPLEGARQEYQALIAAIDQAQGEITPEQEVRLDALRAALTGQPETRPPATPAAPPVSAPSGPIPAAPPETRPPAQTENASVQIETPPAAPGAPTAAPPAPAAEAPAQVPAAPAVLPAAPVTPIPEPTTEATGTSVRGLTRDAVRAAEASQAVELARQAAAASRATTSPAGVSPATELPPAAEATEGDLRAAAQRRGLVTEQNPAWQRFLADHGVGQDALPDALDQAVEAVNRMSPTQVATINAAARTEHNIPAWGADHSRVAVPNRAEPLPVVGSTVNLDDLIASNLDNLSPNPSYPQSLQPRDRTDNRTATQIHQIDARVTTTPEVLFESPEGGNGPPIVQPNGVVLSGNGRVLWARWARANNSPGWQAYQREIDRRQLRAPGGPEAPFFVRFNMATLDDEQLAQMARDLNEDTRAGMSATEKALADANLLTPQMLALFRGGDVGSDANREFAAAFLARLPSQVSLALVGKDGKLTIDGEKRIEAALFARAYGDAALVRAVFESRDGEVKAIGQALLDVAPAWAVMRGEVEAGRVAPEVDWTGTLLAVVNFIRHARQNKLTVPAMIKRIATYPALMTEETVQTPTPAELDAMLFFYDTEDFSGKQVSADTLAGRLLWYAREAMTVQASVDIFGGDPAARIRGILNEARNRRRASPASQPSLLDQPKPAPAPALDGAGDVPIGGDAGGSGGDQAGAGAGEPGAPGAIAAVPDTARAAEPEPAAGEPVGPAPTELVKRARHYLKFIPDTTAFRGIIGRAILAFDRSERTGAVTGKTNGDPKARAKLQGELDDGVARTSNGQNWYGGAKVTKDHEFYTIRGSFGVLEIDMSKPKPATRYHPVPTFEIRGGEGERVPNGPWEDRRSEFSAYARGKPIGDAAAHWVAQRGTDGNEWGVIVAGNGHVISAGTNGATDGLEPGVAPYHVMLVPGAEVVLYHNHPSGRSLSPGDIIHTAFAGLRSIYAVAQGIFYRAGAGARTIALRNAFATAQPAATSSAELAHTKVLRDTMQKAMDVYRDTFFNQLYAWAAGDPKHETLANEVYGHLRNTSLDRMGVIDYESNLPIKLEELPPEMTAAMEVAERAAERWLVQAEAAAGVTQNGADQRALPVRALGDLERLRRAAADDGSSGPDGAPGDRFGPQDDSGQAVPPGEAYWQAYDAGVDSTLPAFVLADDVAEMPTPAQLARAQTQAKNAVPDLPTDEPGRNYLRRMLAQAWKPLAFIAATRPQFANFYHWLLRQVTGREQLLRVLSETMEPYSNATPEVRAEANKALEYGARHHEDYTQTPMPAEIVNDIGGPDDAGGMSTMQRGERITLSDAGKRAYTAVRVTLDRAWTMLRNAWLKTHDLAADTTVDQLRNEAARLTLLAESERAAAEADFRRRNMPTNPLHQMETAASLTKRARKAGIAASKETRTKAENMGKRANELQAFDEMRFTGYVPFMRFGDTYLDVKMNVPNEDGTERLVTVARRQFETKGLNRWGARQRVEEARRALHAAYPQSEGYRHMTVAHKVKPTPSFDFGDLNFADFEAAAREGGASSASTAEVVDGVFRALSTTGFRQHLKRSRDVPGYTANFERALSGYMTGMAGYLAKAEVAKALDESMSVGVMSDPLLRKLADSARKYVSSPQEEWAGWRHFMFFSAIATSPASWLVNMTQVPFFTGPQLQMVAGPVAAARSLMWAGKEAVKLFRTQRSLTSPFGFDYKLAPPQYRKALQWIVDRGGMIPQVTNELMGKTYTSNPIWDSLTPKLQKFLHLSGQVFGGTEEFNRLVTALGSLRAAEGAGVLAKADRVLSGEERARPLVREAEQLRRQVEAMDRINPLDPARTPLINRAMALEKKAAGYGNARFRAYQAEAMRERAADLEARAHALNASDPTRRALLHAASTWGNLASGWVGGRFPDLPRNAGPIIDAKRLALFNIEETQTIPGKVGNPQMMRQAGRVIFQFKQFSINMLTLQWQWLSRYGAEGKLAFAVNMGALLLVAGFMGLPFADDLKELYRSLTGDDFEETWQQLVTEATGGGDNAAMFAEAMRRGLPRYANVELSNRLGFGRVLPMRPLLQMFSNDPNATSSVAGDLMGVSASWLTNGLSAYSTASQGVYNKALEFVAAMTLGGGARNMMQAYNMYSDGLRSGRGNMLMPKPGVGPTSVTPSDIMLRAVGFQSGRMAEALEEYRWQRQAENAASSRSGPYRDRLARAIVANDRDAIARVQQDVADWNSSHPQDTVSISRQSLRMAIRREEQGIGSSRTPRAARENVEAIRRATPSWRLQQGE